MTVPLDPASLLASETNSFTYDEASQVSSASYTYDSRGRQTAAPGHTYTWDNASRLTGIDGVTLAYNGLSDLTTRAEGAAAIHYYYNYAIGLKPIAAEKDEGTEQFLRYYVWTPGGRLLYMIDASDSNKAYFYHFDRTGSTLALTDASGTVTDSYAYNPYGKLLRHNGSSKQPFTFVGEWGVRQEGSGGTFYHIRSRYYDAATARFISRDPMWPNITDALQLNPYQYALNEPVGVRDVTGNSPQREQRMTLRQLWEHRVDEAGGCDALSYEEFDKLTQKATDDFFEWNPVDEKQMTLEELMKHRLFRDNSTDLEKAKDDFFGWHPVDEKQMSLEELMKHRLFMDNFTDLEEAKDDFAKWHTGDRKTANKFKADRISP